MTNSPAAKLVSQGTKIYSPSSIQLQPNPITPTNSIQVPPNISSNRLLFTGGIRYRHDLFLLLSMWGLICMQILILYPPRLVNLPFPENSKLRQDIIS